MPEVERPGGVRIRYEVAGPPSSAALALAHGFGASLEMWAWQLPHLAERHRVVVWDARGHGGSSAPADPAQYSMSAHAADLRAVLEAAGVAGSCVIGGMSFGGQIALQYAVEHAGSTRALVLSDSTTRGPGGGGVDMARVPAEIARQPGLLGAWAGMQGRADLTPRLAELAMPALIIYGDWDDMIVPGIGRLADGLPQRRVVRMSGCYHGTSAQRPREWAQAVLQFLDDVDAGAPVAGELTV